MPSIAIGSEIGRLRQVIVHEPGQEIENVTPTSATEALYDDILFLLPALREHRQMTGVLGQVAEVLPLVPLLSTVLADERVRHELLSALCALHHCLERVGDLMTLAPERLARQLLEGTPMRKDSLAKYLDPGRFDLPPLPNTFFMRDAAMAVGDCAVVGRMASEVRRAEALIMRAVFRHHPSLAGPLCFDGSAIEDEGVSLEGGDVQVLREDLIVIGHSERTSVAGIDRLVAALAARGTVRDVIVVVLPHSRAAIHLDMVFTMIDADLCVVHQPLIVDEPRCRAIHLTLEGGRVVRIHDHDGLLPALASVGLSLEPVPCGGDDPVRQEREQWSSGANFFAFAPGKVIGYGRNRATYEALARRGFEIVDAAAAAAGRGRPLGARADGGGDVRRRVEPWRWRLPLHDLARAARPGRVVRTSRGEGGMDEGAELTITLQQLLKLTGLAASGGEAKVRIQAGEVQVNGEVETRRRRRLRAGDRVALGEDAIVVAFEEEEEEEEGGAGLR